MTATPTHARCVVIGGGIVGCSVAYHLARAGWRDVVLLERDKLTAGSTWHAAGLVGQLRSNANITRLLKHSVELYERLEAETGQASGWKRNGGLRLACNADRMIELRRQATTARSFGLEMHLLSPAEAKDLWPLMDASDLVGAAFLPTDGQANPSDITQALARGARQHGVRIVEDCAVTGFRIEQGWVTGVRTRRGEIACDVVALCAGQWSKAIGRLAGVRVPLQPVQHQYLITEPIKGVTSDLPTLRDPDRLIYFKEEVGGLVMGGYEPDPKPWAEPGIPDGFAFTLLDPDWDHFEQLMRAGAGPRAGARDRGRQAADQRPGILHAGWQLHPRRGAGGAGLLCRLRLQRVRHRRRGRRRPRARRVDRRRRAADGPVAGRHPPLRPAARRRRLGPRAHSRAVRQALHDRLAGRGAPLGPAAAPLAALCAPCRARCCVRREARLGARQLVRPGGSGRAARHLRLRPAELVRCGRRGAPRLPRAGRAVRRQLVRQVPAARPRCRGGAVLDLRERRQPSARPRDLHADAEHPRRHRVRSHRDAPRPRRLLHRHRHRLRDPRLRLDRAPSARARGCAPARRDLGVRGPARHGAAARATCSPG